MTLCWFKLASYKEIFYIIWIYNQQTQLISINCSIQFHIFYIHLKWKLIYFYFFWKSAIIHIIHLLYLAPWNIMNMNIFIICCCFPASGLKMYCYFISLYLQSRYFSYQSDSDLMPEFLTKRLTSRQTFHPIAWNALLNNGNKN